MVDAEPTNELANYPLNSQRPTVLNNGLLTIKGETKEEHETQEENYHLHECHYGSFMRRITLPNNIDAEKIEATNENDVLTLTLSTLGSVKVKTHRDQKDR